MIDNTEKILRMTGLAVRAGKVRFGVYLTLAACESKKARLVIIPRDLGESNKRSIAAKCEGAGIPLVSVSDKQTLGRACGKDDLAALAVTDENFKSAILELYGGGANV